MSQNPPNVNPELPNDFDELDFSVEEENWNEYELNDSSRIRTRAILKKVMVDPNNPNAMAFDMNPLIIVVWTPNHLRGARNQEPTPAEWNTLPNFEVIPQRNDERWNRYRILRSGRLVRMRNTVTRIRRITDRFNNDGMPFFLIDNSPTVVVDPPDNNPGP